MTGRTGVQCSWKLRQLTPLSRCVELITSTRRRQALCSIRKERGSSYLLSHWDLLIKGTTWKRMKRTSRLQSALGARKFASHPGFTSTPTRHCLSFTILHICLSLQPPGSPPSYLLGSSALLLVPYLVPHGTFFTSSVWRVVWRQRKHEIM